MIPVQILKCKYPPKRVHNTDAGMDLHYDGVEPIIIRSNEQALIPTGVNLKMPSHPHPDKVYQMEVRPRSGLAHKFQITVTNAPGTIDEGYTGEIKVILHNLSPEPYQVNPGDRIAQLVMTDAYIPTLETVNTFGTDKTIGARANAGFGSSGVNE